MILADAAAALEYLESLPPGQGNFISMLILLWAVIIIGAPFVFMFLWRQGQDAGRYRRGKEDDNG